MDFALLSSEKSAIHGMTDGIDKLPDKNTLRKGELSISGRIGEQ
jgi:hypothetical protein